VPYTDLLRQSLQIAWRNRWLWLLALFAGETGGGFSGSVRGGNPFMGVTGSGPTSGEQQVPPFWLPDPTSVLHWVQDHAAILAAVGLAIVLVYVALFLLSCACVAAEVRGVQEIDAGRPSGLLLAWNLGLQRFSPVLRLRLAVLLIGVVTLLLFGLVTVAGIVLAVARSWLALAMVVYLGLSLAFVVFLAALLLSVLLPLAVRAAVLEGLPGWGALRRAYALTMARPGRIIACWALMVACQLGFGVLVLIGTVAVGVPALAAVLAVYAAAQLAAAVIVGVIFAVVLGGALLVVSAAFSAFFSAFWTLAYARLEVA
jgi:hypothetical protein